MVIRCVCCAPGHTALTLCQDDSLMVKMLPVVVFKGCVCESMALCMRFSPEHSLSSTSSVVCKETLLHSTNWGLIFDFEMTKTAVLLTSTRGCLQKWVNPHKLGGGEKNRHCILLQYFINTWTPNIDILQNEWKYSEYYEQKHSAQPPLSWDNVS